MSINMGEAGEKTDCPVSVVLLSVPVWYLWNTNYRLEIGVWCVRLGIMPTVPKKIPKTKFTPVIKML